MKVGRAILGAGLALLLAGCGLPSFQSLPAPPVLGGSTYPLRVDFHDVLNLPVGAKVKLAGALVGEVTDVSTSGYVAHVAMRISSAVKLKVGSTFEVRFTTPLGENYVAVTEPASASAFLASGSTVGLVSTNAAPTIEDAFAALSVLINGGGLTQISSIVKELNVALDGRGQTVRQALAGTRMLVADLNRRQHDIDDVLVSLGRLAQTVRGGTVVIDRSLKTFPAALAVLTDQTARLRALLTSVTDLGNVATTVLQRTTGNLVAEVGDLDPILRALASIRGDLAPTMAKLVLFGQKISSAAPGDYLNANGQLSLLLDGSAPILPPSARRGR